MLHYTPAISLTLTALAMLVAGCSQTAVGPEQPAGAAGPFPANFAENVPLDATLSWNMPAVEQAEVEYHVFFGETPDPEHAEGGQHSYSPGHLQPGHTYYWRVELRYADGRIVRWPLWRFRTGYDFRYPLEISRFWHYDISMYYSDFVWYDSLVMPLYSAHLESYVTIDSLVTLHENNKPAFCLSEILVGEDIFPQMSHTWFNNESDGLWNYAYDGVSDGLTIPRKPGILPYRVADERLERVMGMRVVDSRSTAVELDRIFDPALSLAYPLRVGSEWVLLYDETLGYIRKRVVGQRTIPVPGGRELCWVVRWEYDSKRFSAARDIEIIDYIGASGLIERHVTIRNVEFVTYDNSIVAKATWHRDIILRDIGTILAASGTGYPIPTFDPQFE